MTSTNPLVTLNNGVQMPALGLGVFQSKPEETVDAVVTALNGGYRLIDTAAAYMNEREVGEGIRRAEVDRADVFVETKIWITDYGFDSALRAFDVSLNKLGVEYLDLWLLHQPLAKEFDKTLQAYKAAERLWPKGGCVPSACRT
jgi:diketogulonate reductase-like aldo/keto reductase